MSKGREARLDVRKRVVTMVASRILQNSLQAFITKARYNRVMWKFSFKWYLVVAEGNTVKISRRQWKWSSGNGGKQFVLELLSVAPKRHIREAFQVSQRRKEVVDKMY